MDASKKTAKNGTDYWMARDIQGILAYESWNNFENVIEKAKKACEVAGFVVTNHFFAVEKVIEVGKGARGKRGDYYLTKYACYLIAMNGQPGKPEISAAQTYFAAQTHLQEVQGQLTEEQKRIQHRDRVKSSNKYLAAAAKQAGVVRYPLFHNEGYRGLYGMDYSSVKAKKGLSQKDDLLDHAGREELAANEFRITQTEKKLKTDNISGEAAAFKVHREVGAKVRSVIEEIGGTLPEHLPVEPDVKVLIRSNPENKAFAKSLAKSDAR
jgi:DNA-damage-inducible protein D